MPFAPYVLNIKHNSLLYHKSVPFAHNLGTKIAASRGLLCKRILSGAEQHVDYWMKIQSQKK